MPQVGTEAQSCGRAVVGFDIGGLKDIVINNKTGILVKNKNSNDLSKGIKKCLFSDLISDNASFEIRKRASNIWSDDKVNEKYIEVYNYLLNI